MAQTAQNPNGMWVTNIQGWYHNVWFTASGRTTFSFRGPFTLDFFTADDLFVFINGVLVMDLGGTHQTISGQVQIAADGSATIAEGGSRNPNTGAFIPCPGVDPFTMTTTASGADCRTRTLTANQLGNLVIGRAYEIAFFFANRHPTDSELMITLPPSNVVRSTCTPTAISP